MVWQLLEASIHEEGLLEFMTEHKFKWISEPPVMNVDGNANFDDEKNTKHGKRLQSANTVMAIDLIGQFLQNKMTSAILHLACKSM